MSALTQDSSRRRAWRYMEAGVSQPEPATAAFLYFGNRQTRAEIEVRMGKFCRLTYLGTNDDVTGHRALLASHWTGPGHTLILQCGR